MLIKELHNKILGFESLLFSSLFSALRLKSAKTILIIDFLPLQVKWKKVKFIAF
jgi:hypothetical protein